MLHASDLALDLMSRKVTRDGQLIENRMQQLLPVDADALIAGRVSAHADGFGFLPRLIRAMAMITATPIRA